MSNLNKVILSGNLTREPELKQTASGTSILSFSIASNDSRKNAQGQYEDKPNFVDCTIFGNQAAGLSQHLHKGMKVALEGKLDFQAWEDQQGNKRSKLSVIVNQLEFMQTKQQQSQPQQAAAPAPAPAPAQKQEEEIYDGIPF